MSGLLITLSLSLLLDKKPLADFDGKIGQVIPPYQVLYAHLVEECHPVHSLAALDYVIE